MTQERPNTASSVKRYTVVIAVVAIVALIFGTVAGTLAWLEANTNTLTNTFTPGYVTTYVEEDTITTLGVKKDVQIRNTGNIDAYIRVAVIPIWREIDEVTKEATIGTGLPTKDTYTIVFNEIDWFEGNDGYWYHKKPVSFDPTDDKNLTAKLIYTCSPNDKDDLPDEYKDKVFELQIIASGIQSVPTYVVGSVWTAVEVGADGNLTTK